MNYGTESAQIRKRAPAMIAGLLLFLLVLTTLAASSAEAHHWLHPDNAAENHSCFLTILDKGIGDLPKDSAQLVMPVLAQDGTLPPFVVHFASEDLALPGGRGPPFLS